MEQKLIDIMFQIALTIQANPGDFQGMTNEQVAEWVADQLRQCGFPTAPCGMSWGVLQKKL